jgi:hypothetical protein
MISLSSSVSPDILARTNNVLWVVNHLRRLQLEVIEVGEIISVVAMLPLENDSYFILEEMKLSVDGGIVSSGGNDEGM